MREVGWYWVKLNNKFEVMDWDGVWWNLGMAMYYEADLDWVDSKRLIPPNVS